jgi:hypothetical protein
MNVLSSLLLVLSVLGSLVLALGSPTRKRGGVLVLLVCCLFAASANAQESITDPAVVTPVDDTTTLNKMIDEEAAKLPFLRRKIVQRLLADEDDREKLVERVTLKLAESKDNRLKPMQATFGSEEFTGDTPMQLSPEIKQIIADLLKQLLPILLALIFKV